MYKSGIALNRLKHLGTLLLPNYKIELLILPTSRSSDIKGKWDKWLLLYFYYSASVAGIKFLVTILERIYVWRNFLLLLCPNKAAQSFCPFQMLFFIVNISWMICLFWMIVKYHSIISSSDFFLKWILLYPSIVY